MIAFRIHLFYFEAQFMRIHKGLPDVFCHNGPLQHDYHPNQDALGEQQSVPSWFDYFPILKPVNFNINMFSVQGLCSFNIHCLLLFCQFQLVDFTSLHQKDPKGIFVGLPFFGRYLTPPNGGTTADLYGTLEVQSRVFEAVRIRAQIGPVQRLENQPNQQKLLMFYEEH